MVPKVHRQHVSLGIELEPVPILKLVTFHAVRGAAVPDPDVEVRRGVPRLLNGEDPKLLRPGAPRPCPWYRLHRRSRAPRPRPTACEVRGEALSPVRVKVRVTVRVRVRLEVVPWPGYPRWLV